MRRLLEVAHGGHVPSQRFNWFLAGSVFAEDGWRDSSPSEVRQLFGKVGWERDRGSLNLTRGAREQLADGQRPPGLPAARARLREHLHEARHDRQHVHAVQRGPAPCAAARPAR